jgi:hypothetical protein
LSFSKNERCHVDHPIVVLGIVSEAQEVCMEYDRSWTVKSPECGMCGGILVIEMTGNIGGRCVGMSCAFGRPSQQRGAFGCMQGGIVKAGGCT